MFVNFKNVSDISFNFAVNSIVTSASGVKEAWVTGHHIVNIYAFGITPTETISLLADRILIGKQYFFQVMLV